MTPLKAVHLSLLDATFDNMVHRTKYVYGAKAPSLDCDSHDIHGIDCSGWSRYGLAKASKGALIIPDGSQVQLAWAQTHLRNLNDYSDMQRYAGADPTRLFICFLRVTNLRRIGHVWLGRSDGHTIMTMESHSGVGVDARPWNASALHSCTDCFEIPATT